MPKFSIKDLMIATLLIAFGAGIAAMSWGVFPPTSGGHSNPTLEIALLLFESAGGALIGAGLLTPLHHPWFGVYLGMIVNFLFLWYW